MAGSPGGDPARDYHLPGPDIGMLEYLPEGADLTQLCLDRGLAVLDHGVPGAQVVQCGAKRHLVVAGGGGLPPAAPLPTPLASHLFWTWR